MTAMRALLLALLAAAIVASKPRTNSIPPGRPASKPPLVSAATPFASEPRYTYSTVAGSIPSQVPRT